MMKGFALEVDLNVSVDDAQRSSLHQATLQSTDDIFVAYSTRIRISPRQETTSHSPWALVFVPPTLVDAVIELLPENNHAVFPIQRQSQQISNSILNMIQPYLGRNFTTKFIIPIRPIFDAQHAPSDVIILDLSQYPTAASIDELLDASNCSAIQNGSNLVLKILLISSITFLLHDEHQDATSNVASLSPPRIDIPTCPVCLHRIEPTFLGLPRPSNHQLCSKFCRAPNYVTADDDSCPQQQMLRPWPPPSFCVVCDIVQSYWNDNYDESMDLFCCICAMQETLWVCMTCGFVGCGRYSNKHAAQHFIETGHDFALELATLRIWEYVNGEFAHRIDLLECASSPSVLHPWSRKTSRPAAYSSSGPVDEKTPKKATMIGEEYETLLQSALEEQAQHYEGEITRLRAKLTAEHIDQQKMTPEEAEEVETLKSEIAELRQKIDQVSRELIGLQGQEAGQRATSQRLLREQQVAKELLKKIQEESSLEYEKGRMHVDDLKQQIADLTANQSIRKQFVQNEELANAQIWGTSNEQSVKAASKKGKKTRKFFRK